MTTEAFDDNPLVRSSVSMTVTIPAAVGDASGYYVLDALGEAFYFIGATAPILAATDQSTEKEYRKGTGERFPRALNFRRIEIRNSRPYPVRITIWAGFGEYVDTRLDLIEGYTEIEGETSTQIPANEEIVLDGVPSLDRLQRKAVIVTNLDPNNPLRIADANGHYIAAVFKESSVMLPISGAVIIENATGSPIDCYIGQIWYTENRV